MTTNTLNSLPDTAWVSAGSDAETSQYRYRGVAYTKVRDLSPTPIPNTRLVYRGIRHLSGSLHVQDHVAMTPGTLRYRGSAH